MHCHVELFHTVNHYLPSNPITAFAFFSVLFFVLARLFPCNPEMHWWKNDKKEILGDALYFFVVPILSGQVRLLMLFLGATLVLGLKGAEVESFFREGYGSGVFSSLPFWGQVAAYMLLGDVMMYWIHRVFHKRFAWKVHAVHHSTAHLDWLASARFHPINMWLQFMLTDVIMLCLGIAPMVMMILAPMNQLYSAMVHANLRWTFGPFRYVLASPVFHRWHHTKLIEGRDKNFAPTFPFLDVLFGTFYMPKGKLPEQYGVDDPRMPNSFIGQLLYPFAKNPRP